MDPIPDDELLAMAIEFDLGPEPLISGRPFWWHFYSDDIRRNSVSVRNMGEDRWAILAHGGCLNKGGEWQFQGMPSSRSEDFYTHCRYSSEHAAITYYRRWREVIEAYALEKYKEQGVEFRVGMPLEDYKKVTINYNESPLDDGRLSYETLCPDLG